MISLQFSRRQSLLALFLLLAVVDFANSMYVTKIRRLPLSSISYRQAGLLRKRALDQLDAGGFGFTKRALDSLDAGGFGFTKRALDSLDGRGFSGMDRRRRALDAMEGAGFGFQKRALDAMEGAGFGFQKRALDSLEGRGFSGLSKRALDALDGRGFGLNKRALDSLESGGFGFEKRSDRYLRVPADEWYRLELLKQELNDEIRRRQFLDEAQSLSDQQQVLIV